MIPISVFSSFTKTAGLLDGVAKRARISGLKVPRIATPRLGAGVLPGKTPINPFRVNWHKLGSVGHALVGLGAVGAVGTGAVLGGERLLHDLPPEQKPPPKTRMGATLRSFLGKGPQPPP